MSRNYIKITINCLYVDWAVNGSLASIKQHLGSDTVCQTSNFRRRRYSSEHIRGVRHCNELSALG